MVTYIVECSICQQPWDVPQPLVSAPPLVSIVIPPHEMLSRPENRPLGFPCIGPQVPGMGLGSREAWERNWPLRHSARALPSVRDGANAVKVLNG